MDERTRDALQDMVDHAREAHMLATRVDVADALADRVTRLAIERLLEIVGEAASRVPDHARADIEVPWREIVGLRNLLVHAYRRTDPETLAPILVSDLPQAADRIASWLEEHGG